MSFISLIIMALSLSDDGQEKPVPREEGKGPSSKSAVTAKKMRAVSSSSNKSRSDSTSHDNSGEYMCLIRATLNKEKISTVVMDYIA